MDLLVLDISDPTSSRLREIAGTVRRYNAPSLALVLNLDPDIERQIRSLGVQVARRRPDPALLGEPSFTRPLVSIIKATILVHGRQRPRVDASSATRRSPPPRALPSRSNKVADHAIVIAASTGGPPAVRRVIEDLKTPDRYTVLIVQHISAAFSQGYARWLGEATGRTVEIARNAERITAGSILVAPGDAHLAVRKRAAIYDYGDKRNFQRPSADVLFETAAREWGENCVAIILTGMGEDGAAGCVAVRDAGGHVVAQDEESSVVWGMPRAAIERKAADVIAPIEEIGRRAEAELLRRAGAIL